MSSNKILNIIFHPEQISDLCDAMGRDYELYYHPVDVDFQDDVLATIVDLQERVRELEHPWISVDEPPEEWNDSVVISDGCTWRALGDLYESYNLIVTHWMPIPKLEE